MNADEMTEEEIVRFVATLKRVRERGDEGRTAVVRAADLGAVIDGWLTALHERDEARAEVGRAVAAEREACAVICDAIGDAAETERDACCDDRSRSLHAGRMHGADECARAIRARGATDGAR